MKQTAKNPKIKFFKKKSGRWHWSIIVRNGNLVAQCPSVGYPTKAACIKGFESSLKNALLIIIPSNYTVVDNIIMSNWKTIIKKARKAAGRNATIIEVW